MACSDSVFSAAPKHCGGEPDPCRVVPNIFGACAPNISKLPRSQLMAVFHLKTEVLSDSGRNERSHVPSVPQARPL